MVSVSCWLVLLSPVGTHDLCVRCIKGYSVVLCQRLQHRGLNGDGRSGRASLQDFVTASVEWKGVRCIRWLLAVSR